MVSTTLIIGIIILVIGILIGLGAIAYYFYRRNDYDYLTGNAQTTVWVLAGVAILFLLVGAILTGVGAYYEEERKKTLRENYERKAYPVYQQQEHLKRGLTQGVATTTVIPPTAYPNHAQIALAQQKQAYGGQLTPEEVYILQAARLKQEANRISTQEVEQAAKQLEAKQLQKKQFEAIQAASFGASPVAGIPTSSSGGAVVPESRVFGARLPPPRLG